VLDSDSAEAARTKIRALFGETHDAASLADTLASALGLQESTASHDDLEWAVRRKRGLL